MNSPNHFNGNELDLIDLDDDTKDPDEIAQEYFLPKLKKQKTKDNKGKKTKGAKYSDDWE